MVLAGVEEALHLLVPEQLEHLVGQLDGALEVAWLQRGGVRCEQGVDEAGVVLEVTLEPRFQPGFQVRRSLPSGRIVVRRKLALRAAASR